VPRSGHHPPKDGNAGAVCALAALPDFGRRTGLFGQLDRFFGVVNAFLDCREIGLWLWGRSVPHRMEVVQMENCNPTRRPFAALAVAAALICGPGAASAATVLATLDFGTDIAEPASPYVEDGFEVSGISLGLANAGNPTASILLDRVTALLTLTRVGGGVFSLVSFDYSCIPGLCDFSVGSTAITSGSLDGYDFATISPAGFDNITSLVFTRNSSDHLIDNIVLEFDDGIVLPPAPIPVPAAFPLLLGAVAGLGLMARRRGRTS
jgi:hypothetical protein